MRNVLSVPEDLAKWIQLKHYQGISQRDPKDVPSVERLQTLRNELAATRNLARSLTTERSRNEVALQQLRSMLNPSQVQNGQPNLSFLTTSLDGRSFSGQQPITANTKFALSQLPALKATLAELSEKSSALKSLPPRNDTAQDELREERRQYIEQTAKSHLHRNGHSELTAPDSLSGKQPDPAELEALQRVAKAFNPP